MARPEPVYILDKINTGDQSDDECCSCSTMLEMCVAVPSFISAATRSPPAGEFVCRSLDLYPFDHSAPDLSTRIRCLCLRHERAPPGDVEMDKLLHNQGAHIFGDKLKCNNSRQTHKNSKYV